VVTDNSSKIRAVTKVVGEVPEGGLIRWGEHDRTKELLDLLRFRVSGVKREVQEDSFRGLALFSAGVLGRVRRRGQFLM
jgi:hypothetical protein